MISILILVIPRYVLVLQYHRALYNVHLHNAEFTYMWINMYLHYLFFLCSTMYVLYIDALIVIVTNIYIYLLHDISSMDILVCSFWREILGRESVNKISLNA